MNSDQTQEKNISLSDYLWVIYKHRRAASAFFAFTVLVAVVYVFAATPVYRATTKILIERENPNAMEFKDLYTLDATSQDFYQTQYRILESRNLAKFVVESMRLYENAEFNPDRALPADPNEAAGKMEDVITAFIKKLKVSPVRNTMLVEIKFDSSDSELSARAANKLVDAYIAYSNESKLQTSHGTMDFLSSKIEEQRKKLEESEILLQQYKENYNIISLEEEQKVTAEKFAELTSNILKAESERVAAEVNYQHAKSIENDPSRAVSIPMVLNNQFIMSLKATDAKLSEELSDLSLKYGPKHPQIQTVKEKLSSTRGQITHEIKTIVSFLKNEYEVALAREQALRKALTDLRDESRQLGQHAVEYGVLAREVELNKQLYTALLTRLKETGIAGRMQSMNVRVVDAAKPPIRPVSPKRAASLLLALLLGLMGGVGMAFLFEYLDDTIKGTDDLERYVKIPCLGVIPDYKDALENAGAEGKNTLVSLSDPKSIAAESYRGLRTSILFSSSSSAHKTLLITSAKPSEGKSLTATNLAITMAQSGNRTLLIDVDFRKPNLHKLFNLNMEKGFSNLLVGAVNERDIIIKSGLPNLDIITCGHIPPNPAELLGSEAARRYIGRFREAYDRVIFDSPPIMPATDPVILSTLVDEVVVVIMAGKTSRHMLMDSVKKLRQVRANLLGAVLNNVKAGKEGYYYGGYYNYGYEGDSKAERRHKQAKGKEPEVPAPKKA